MHVSRLLVSCFFFFVLTSCQPLCLCAEKDEGRKEADNTTKASAGAERPTPFLGVVVDELHPAIVSHIPEVALGGQGVLVREISNNSPASKVGIKPHDILTTYDDQKLFSI